MNTDYIKEQVESLMKVQREATKAGYDIGYRQGFFEGIVEGVRRAKEVVEQKGQDGSKEA